MTGLMILFIRNNEMSFGKYPVSRDTIDHHEQAFLAYMPRGLSTVDKIATLVLVHEH